MRLERLIKKLSEASDMSFPQRFRFNTLIARYYLYRDLWRRTQLDQEMGAEAKTKAATLADASGSIASIPAEAVRVSISDPKNEEAKIRQLYDALLQVKGADRRETSMPYPQFVKYITARTQALREKHGCARVSYVIAMEEGAIRFIAAAEDA